MMGLGNMSAGDRMALERLNSSAVGAPPAAALRHTGVDDPGHAALSPHRIAEVIAATGASSDDVACPRAANPNRS